MRTDPQAQDMRATIAVLAETHSAEVIDIALKLVAIPSPQPEGDVRGVADAIVEIARTMPGVEIERHIEQEPVHNIVLRLRGNRPGKTLVFNGHTDTFPLGDLTQWEANPQGEIVDDKLYGLGISDMKGGIAAGLFALKTLAEAGADFPGEIVCTYAGDEETMGDLGTKFLLDTVPHAKGDAMISGDAGSPYVLRFGEKGMIWANFSAKGRSSHSAHVHKGDSAIEKLTAVMAAVAKLRDIPNDSMGSNIVNLIDRWSDASEEYSGKGETDVLKKVTVTFGTFEGGRLSNLVADRAHMTADIRIPIGITVAEIEAELMRVCGQIDGVEMEVVRRFEPSWTPPEHEIVESVRQNCRDVLGKEIAVTMRVGASDARLYRHAGVPSVVCGLSSYNLGAPNEYVLVDELRQLGKIFALSAYDYLVSSA